MRGVDVSPTYQPAVDWGQLRAGGYGFAYLKATEGASWPDPRSAAAPWLREQHDAADHAGVLVGAYHFARPSTTPGDAVEQARFFLARTAGMTWDLPPALDLEVTGELPPAQLVEWARTWLSATERAVGRPAVLYTYPSFLSDALAGWAGDGRRLWLADPSGTTDRPRWMTQRAQQPVPGIAGAVDVDDVPDPTPAPDRQEDDPVRLLYASDGHHYVSNGPAVRWISGDEEKAWLAAGVAVIRGRDADVIVAGARQLGTLTAAAA